MKKLMAVAAALVAGATFAALNGVQSNVVGFQQLPTQPGFNFSVATFNSVATEEMSIQDIKLINATDCDQLQLLDAGGATLITYWWVNGRGWIDANVMQDAVATIKAGQSFLLSIQAEGTKVQYAGQVSTEKTVISNTVSGFNWVGNNVPRDINIQDIKLINATDCDQLQLLDAGGSTEVTYWWVNGMGWIDAVTMQVADVTLKAGQGFIIAIANAGASIELPAGL